MIRVSVVVPTGGRLGALDRCLEALLDQDYDPSAYEVIVVDYAEGAGTQDMVEYIAAHTETISYVSGTAARTPAGKPEPPGHQIDGGDRIIRTRGIPIVRYLRDGQRRGPGGARNTGWHAASGRIVAFTREDCIPSPDWLSAGVHAMKTSGVSALGGRVRVAVADTMAGPEADVPPDGTDFSAANCFYRRSTLAACGGFDERFCRDWGEDSDLYFEVLRHGFATAVARDSVVARTEGTEGWGAELRRQRRNMFYALLFRKHPALYRSQVEAMPPWRYYLAVLAMAAVPPAAATGRSMPALAAGFAWVALTARLMLTSLLDESHTPAQVLNAAVTSVLIPPVAIFWRLAGAVRFRVPFL